MRFIRTDVEGATAALQQRLEKELGQGKQVLWLLSGGSNIAPAVAIMRALAPELTAHLVISLADERYGEIDHVDSNAKQLLDAGFQTKEAVFIPVLQPGFSAEETTHRFSEASQQAFAHADTVIALLGIGPDGHIAGILPHTPAVTATGWVTTYQTPTYTRISLTFEALRQVSATYVFAWGETKLPTLTTLHDETVPLEEQPAQFLKELPAAYVYNDVIGGKS